MWRKASFLLFQFLLINVDLATSQEQLILQNYGMDDGLPNFWIPEAIQDPYGFIWFGTGSGLCRFDGKTFETYPYQHLNNSRTGMDRIYILEVDDDGVFWISRSHEPLERFNPLTQESTLFPSDSNSLANDMIIEIYPDGELIWVGHSGSGGLSCINKTSGEIKNYQFESEKVVPIPHEKREALNQVWDVHRGLEGILWIATEFGLYKFDPENESFIRYYFENLDPKTHRTYYENILDLEPGKLVVESSAGPLEFNTSTGTFRQLFQIGQEDHYYFGGDAYAMINQGVGWFPNHGITNQGTTSQRNSGIIQYDFSSQSSITHNIAPSKPLLLDRSGVLWLMDSDRGVSSFKMGPNKVQTYFYQQLGIPDDQATACMTDVTGSLWIGTETGLFHLENEQGNWNVQDNFKDKIGSPRVTSLFQAKDTTIWVGTDRGLYMFSPDNQTFTKKHMGIEPNENPFEENILDIYQDNQGNILFSGKGLAIFDPEDESIEFFDSESIRFLDHMVQDQYGTLWFIKPGGEIVAFDYDSESFHVFDLEIGGFMNDLEIDDSGTLWIGNNTGLYRVALKPLDLLIRDGVDLSNQNRLISSDYVGNVEARGEDLWILHAMGLDKVNTKNWETKTYEKGDGLVERPWTGQFLNNSKTNDESIYYFWRNRFSVIDPDDNRINTYVPPVVISNLSISNKIVQVGDSIDGTPVITKAIYDTELLILPTGQTFSLEFAALDYSNPKKNLYSYKMEGLDDDWSIANAQNSATYTNLWEGDYTFRVRGSNNDGIWNKQGATLKITILPPWYRSKIAYGIYGGLLILALVVARNKVIASEQEKAKHRLRTAELEQARALDEAKTQFFSNISHEFRTPLTLILGPIKRMYEGTFTGDTHAVLGLVIRNSNRLLHLVNQLLDFSKLEAGGVQLQASVGDLVEFTRTMFSAFETRAQEQEITFMFQSSASSLPAYFDRDKLEKVIINLLSNAFRFSKQGDTINLKMIRRTGNSTIDHGEGVVEILIEDTGIGISEAKLPYIFDRFYQSDPSNTREQEGTGIGLALAKQMVELHHGSITVTSKKGKGSTFIIHLPLGKAHLSEDEIVFKKGYKPIDVTAIDALPAELDPLLTNHENGNGSDLPLMLIVEDNEDMRSYLKEVLSERFHIEEAKDGQLGWEEALKLTPDIIISDVMMPGMDGYQLCQKLKTDERTSHIPVVLLTARAGEEAKLEGLQIGADDYITKPFGPNELRARVHNLIELRRNLRERFGKKLSFEPKEIAITSMDEHFLQRALDIVEIHKSDADFNAEAFAREIGMSRSQLHRKLKALTNQSAGDFVRSYRLKYARQLIDKGFGNVTQVAYECGFNSPSYFAECFKKLFGKLPSEYAKVKD